MKITKKKNCNQLLKQLLILVISTCRDLSVPSALAIDLFTVKSRHCFQPGFFIHSVIAQSILSECAPTTSLHVILDHYQSIFSSCFTRSGFVCHDCTSREKHSAPIYCANCSLCPVGTYSCTDGSRCLPCPAGNEKKQLLYR